MRPNRLAFPFSLSQRLGSFLAEVVSPLPCSLSMATSTGGKPTTVSCLPVSQVVENFLAFGHLGKQWTEHCDPESGHMFPPLYRLVAPVTNQIGRCCKCVSLFTAKLEGPFPYLASELPSNKVRLCDSLNSRKHQSVAKHERRQYLKISTVTVPHKLRKAGYRGLASGQQ